MSTTNASTADLAPVLPAASVAVAVILCVPSSNAAVGVNVHLPVASAVVLPNKVVPSKTLTLVFASAVPAIAGVFLFVAAFSVIDGAAGGVVSTTNASTAEAPLVLPAVSLAVAVILCVPSAKAVVGANVQ